MAKSKSAKSAKVAKTTAKPMHFGPASKNKPAGKPSKGRGC